MKYLEYIRSLPCLMCDADPAGEAAHVRMSDAANTKPITGMGTKPHDRWSVPLCSGCHRNRSDAQHRNGERSWWSESGIEPLPVCVRLDNVFPNQELARAVIFRAREPRT